MLSSEQRGLTYYADVHMPSLLSAFANTGRGSGSYWLGHRSFGLGSVRAVRRLERRFIRHARKDSLRARTRRATVTFTCWPARGDAPYRVVAIENGKVVSDERRNPDWSAK